MNCDPQPSRRAEIQMALFNSAPAPRPDIIPTGFIGLDAALQIGGLPRGHILELFGPESSGKSTIALQAIAAAQQAGCQAAYVDAEGTLDTRYAMRLGVDLAKLIIIQPTGGEQSFRILLRLVQSGAIDFAVIDSIASLDPSYSGNMMHSDMCATFLRRLSLQIARSKCCLMIINQLRSRMKPQSVGPDETTTGGWSVKLFSSIRVDLQIMEVVKGRSGPVGQRVQAKVVKNRLALGQRQINLTLQFGTGFSAELDLLESALQHELLERCDDDYVYGDVVLGESLEQAVPFLAERKDVGASMRHDLEMLMGILDRKPMAEARGEIRARAKSA